MTNNIQLGATYKDKITGMQGVATGYVHYISGCNQVLIAPKSKDGSDAPAASWFDVQRLERSGDELIELNNGQTPGFDKAAPVR